MSLTGRQVQVSSYPAGRSGQEHFKVVDVPMDPVGPGQVLVRNTWTSVDPGLRLRLREAAPEGYFVAFPLHAAMDGIMTIGEVVESRADGFAVGDTVWHALGWREYAVVDASRRAARRTRHPAYARHLDRRAAVVPRCARRHGPHGVRRAVGRRRAQGRRDRVGLGRCRRGRQPRRPDREAARQPRGRQRRLGRQGPMAARRPRGRCGVQLSVRARRARAWRAAAPEGIDVYFDCVGGDHLEAALDGMRRGGRVAICGSISEYESEPAGPRNLFLAVAKDLTIRGFRGSSNLDLLQHDAGRARHRVGRRPVAAARDRLRRPRQRTRTHSSR